MIIFRWTMAVLLSTVFVALAAANAIFIVGNLKCGKKRSWLPLLGGTAGSLALVVAPAPALNSAWWVPLLVDPGSVPGVVTTLVILLVRHVRKA
jgi:hypothetical protein